MVAETKTAGERGKRGGWGGGGGGGGGGWVTIGGERPNERERKREGWVTGEGEPLKTTVSFKALARRESFARLPTYLFSPSAHHLSHPLHLSKSAPSIYLTAHLSIYRSIHLPALITPHRWLFSLRTARSLSALLSFWLFKSIFSARCRAPSKPNLRRNASLMARLLCHLTPQTPRANWSALKSTLFSRFN